MNTIRKCLVVGGIAQVLLPAALLLFGANLGAATVDNFIPRGFTNAQGVLLYRLFIPTNYSAGTRYPITLYLHGAGERGSDNRLQLTGQTGCLVFVSEANQLKNPSFMVAPQCPPGGAWADATRRAQVLGLMNSLIAEFSLDTNRLYITGLSMGGIGTWDYIGQFPTMYAAAVPMSGNGSVSLASRMTLIPIWNFHSVNDTVVNVNGSRNMIDAVRRAGGNPIYTEYATGGHGIWTPAYNTPGLMDWIYSQRRGTNSTVGPLLTIKAPTDLSVHASSTTNLALSGTASDGSGGPGSITWTNYAGVFTRGDATGTTTWEIGNVVLRNAITNLILVTGSGTSWYPAWGGRTTFNDTLTVIFPPFISVQPQSRAVNEGDIATFTVAVNAEAVSPRYQWYHNGTGISGATKASLALTNVQSSAAGSYSVRITNQFGAVTSSNAILAVNRLPIAQCLDVIVGADENCQAQSWVDKGSYDPDGDAITLTQWPPGPYSLGTNIVVLTVTDSLGASNSCSSTIIVRDTIQPVIYCPADIRVTTPHDQLTLPVTFKPEVSDNCSGVGQPVCDPPSGSAFGPGTHAVTCVVFDSAGNSSRCTFNVIVQSGNAPPVPVIEVSPLARFPGYTDLLVIAADNEQAAVVFDGSRSYDVDDSHFHSLWYEGTNLFSTNLITTNLLSVGTHQVTLKLDDTYPLGTNTADVLVEVVKPSEAVVIIIDLLDEANLPHNRRQPLLASLTAAAAAFDRGNLTSGVNQLRAFQNKVSAQVMSSAPQLAGDLDSAAQTILDALVKP